VTAADDRFHRDAFARRDTVDTVADLVDRPGELVAEQLWQVVGVVVLTLVPVVNEGLRPAVDADRLDANPNLARPRFGDWDGLER